MLIRDQDLLSLRMIATDGSAHPITDVLVREDGLQAACVVADVGAWLAGHRVRIGIERFDPPDVSGGEWRAAIGAAALEEAPDRNGDAGALRSVVAVTKGVHVEAEDGRAGKLMGLIFETDDWSARHLVVETGDDGLPKNQRVVPAKFIDGVDWDGGSIRLAVTREKVRASPDLHEIDGLQGKWYNKVLAYYGLQS